MRYTCDSGSHVWGPAGFARCEVVLNSISKERNTLWVRGGGCASPARQGQSPASRPSTIDHAIDREVRGDRVGSSIFSSHGTDPRSKIEVQPGSAAGAASGGECLTAACSRSWHGPGRRPAAARRLMNRIRFDSAVFERTYTIHARGALSLQCKVYTRARAADPPRSLALQINDHLPDHSAYSPEAEPAPCEIVSLYAY